LARQHGGSIDFAPLKNPPKTWTVFPDLKTKLALPGSRQPLLPDLRSIVIILPAVDDKKI
jgi:hypothetical protein